MSQKFENIFNRDFYPTPNSVLDLMMLDLKGEIVLEPSAGKGNIIDYAKENGAKDVLFCEINNGLATICKTKARFLKSNFLEVSSEEISHITMIVMNPPFSEAVKHLQHAWDIAPQGCQIVSLFNSNTLWEMRYSRSELKQIIENNGIKIELGNCFNEDAERKTDVEIVCIKLYKPIESNSTEFEGFYMDEEPEYRNDTNGIIKYNEIQSLVNGYISAMRCFDEFSGINERMKNICRPVGMDAGFKYELNYNNSTANKEDFSKELQRKSWLYIFGKMNLNKFLTSGVLDDINKFTEQQSKIPFTVKNIYRMLEIIVGTAGHNFNRALVEAVDAFTKHTHENRYNVEGWKTNSGYMLNKKFIVDWVFETTYGYNGKLSCRYSSNTKKISDLEKVLCNITGSNFDEIRSLDEMVRQFKGLEPNRWYCNGFFEIKGFKKGTAHIKFQNEEHWLLLNKKYGEIKGFTLFEGTEQTKYQDKQTGRDKQEKANPAHAYKPNFTFTPSKEVA